MRILQVLLVGFLFTSAFGCRDSSVRWAGTVSDSAGVTVVNNPEAGLWNPEDAWTLEEELRVGTVEGDPDYQFGQVMGVTVDSRGRLYVLDFQGQQVKVFSSEGVFQQTIAGPGEGPGELRGAVAVLMGPADTLLVQDNRAFRINRYAPDGSSAGGFRIPLEERHPQQYKVTDSGVFAVQFETPDTPGQEAADSPVDVIAQLTTAGTLIDTLLAYPSLAVPGRHIYEPSVSWDITDGPNLVYGVSDDYRLEIHSGNRLRRVITKPFLSEPISDQEEEAILDRWAQEAIESGAPEDWVARRRPTTHVADHVPAFRTIAFGPSGTIWVQRVRPVSELLGLEEPDFNDVGSQHWDIFNPEGRFLGTLLMPPGFTPHIFRRNQLYGVLRDELGVQYVVRYGVVGADGLETT